MKDPTYDAAVKDKWHIRLAKAIKLLRQNGYEDVATLLAEKSNAGIRPPNPQ